MNKASAIDKWNLGMGGFNAARLVENPLLTEPEWRFPYRRFVEWEPQDEDWARKMGFGKEVQVPSKTVYQVGGKFIAHPETIQKMKEAFNG